MYSLSINPHTISSDRMNDYLKAMGRPEETLGKVTESKTFPTTTQIVKGLHSTQPHTMAELGSPLFTMSAHTAQGQGQRCILQQSAATTYRSVHLRSTNTRAEHVLRPKYSPLQLPTGGERPINPDIHGGTENMDSIVNIMLLQNELLKCW